MTPAWRRSALCMPPSWAPQPPVSIDTSGDIHQPPLMSTEAAEPPRNTVPDTRLTLGQLRTFLAVASTGSVRAAAEALVVTQPAVSSALAAVRKQVGVALVARDGRGLRLTPAGEALAERARAALALLDEAVAAARGEADPGRGRLRLASVTTAGEHLAPPLLASFLAAHPGVSVSLEVGNRRRVADLLSHHEVDLAIGGRPPPGAQTLAVRDNRLVVVASPTYPVGARAENPHPVRVL